LAAFVGLAIACDRNIEPYQPGEEPREPDLARIFPSPPAGAAAGMAGGGEVEAPIAAGAETAVEGEGGGASRAAFPPSRTEGAGSSAVAGQPISGRIEVAPALAGEAPEGAVLFVIARTAGATGGPPLAVLRIPEPELPLEFEIGPGDVMIPSMRFEGLISLSARLDADGNAMTRGPTDLSSAVAESLSPGTTDVTLVLAQKG
jgi:hypothetical protein